MNINVLLELIGLCCALSSLNQWNQLKIHGFFNGWNDVRGALLSNVFQALKRKLKCVFACTFFVIGSGGHIQLTCTIDLHRVRAFSPPATNRFVKFLVLLMILQLYGVDSFVAGLSTARPGDCSWMKKVLSAVVTRRKGNRKLRALVP